MNSTITLNGETRSLGKIATVAALLDSLGHAGRRVAVEKNGEIVPKSLHPATQLTDGDRIEIVVAVGGG
ncbi:MAG: sulfur carrier protein ThiS [Georgfuchsia sp.]